MGEENTSGRIPDYDNGYCLHRSREFHQREKAQQEAYKHHVEDSKGNKNIYKVLKHIKLHNNQTPMHVLKS